MIQYRAGKWGIGFAFSLKGSVFPRAMVFALPGGIFAAILQYVLADLDHGMGNLNGGALSGFYSVLGFLIVFRSQQAYSRWWEGGGLLQQMRGEWFNAYSSCLAFCSSAPEKATEVEAFQHLLVRLMSMLYGAALTDVSEMSDSRMEFLDLTGLSDDSLVFLHGAHVKSEIILQWIQRLIHEAAGAEVIKIAPPILSRVYNQLGNGIVLLNNAQKLNEFPVPFPVAQMILFMLMLHWFLTAMVCATSVTTPYWAFFQSFVVVFIYWSVHYIGEELEQPFGDDANDLPIIEMQADMNASLLDLMSTQARHPPGFRYSPEKHGQLKKVLLGFDWYLSQVKRQVTAEPFQTAKPEVASEAELLPQDTIAASVDHVVVNPGIGSALKSLNEPPVSLGFPAGRASAAAESLSAAESLMRNSAMMVPEVQIPLDPPAKQAPSSADTRMQRSREGSQHLPDNVMPSRAAPSEHSALRGSGSSSKHRSRSGRQSAADRRRSPNRTEEPFAEPCCPAGQMSGKFLAGSGGCMGW